VAARAGDGSFEAVFTALADLTQTHHRTRAWAIHTRPVAFWVEFRAPTPNDPFDFDIDAVIFNVYNTKQIANAEKHLLETEKKFPGKPILTGLYLNAGSERRWLTEEEFGQLMDLFIRHINEGKTIGLRIFRAQSLIERPEYMTWAKEMLKKLKQR
jgi:hypothetical protein